MKKVLYILLGLIGVLLILLFLVPVFFKDEIKAKLDQEMANMLDAKVLFEADDVGLSVFRNFPNVTIAIDDLALVGEKEGFKGDTLYYAESTTLVADIWSVVAAEKIKVNSVKLIKPVLLTKMLEGPDGELLNSWDFMKETEGEEEEEIAEPTEFAIAFEKWEIEDGVVIYDDATLPMYAELRHFNHVGKGDLTEEQFIMDTHTESSDAFLSYDNITYLKNGNLLADMKLDMNYNTMDFRFLENQFRVNDFEIGLDGSISMPGDDIAMDLAYEAAETDFKHLISLVPAIYTKDYEDLEAAGKVSFDGTVKGIYNDTTMPGYTLNLVVNNGMFHYPDLPESVKDVAIDLHVKNEDGITENTTVDLKNFHMMFGTNPLDAEALIEGFGPSKIKADVQAKFNLADIMKVYPMEGTDLKGLFSLNLKADGIYSEELLPKMTAILSLKNGYVKTEEVADPLEDIHFTANVKNSDGTMQGSSFSLENFAMQFQDEPFSAQAYIEDFDNPSYDVALKGILDLTKLIKLYPLENTTVSGRIKADVKTAGRVSDIQEGLYMKTSTSGTMDINNLSYQGEDFPQGMKINTARVALSPERLDITGYDGTIGKSDLKIDGYISNYMGYMFGDQDTVIRGKMALASDNFDVNEWLEEEEEEEADTLESEGVFEVPADIDFVLNSNISTLLYDNMTLNDFEGNVIIRDGILTLQKVGFKTLDGAMVANGSYNTQNLNDPKYDFTLDIKEISIPKAYETFNTIQKLAPVAESMEGKFSTNIRINGGLDQEMMPVYDDMNGGGVLMIQSAKVKDNEVLRNVQDLTKVSMLPMQLKDMVMNFTIKDGALVLDKPVDIKAGKTKLALSGSQKFTGEMNYEVDMAVPAGSTGDAAGKVVSDLSGVNIQGPDTYTFLVGVTGNYAKPKIKLLKAGATGGSTKKEMLEAGAGKLKDEVMKTRQGQEAAKTVESGTKKLEEATDKKQKELEQKAEKKVQEQKEKAREETEKKAKEGLKDLKKGLGF